LFVIPQRSGGICFSNSVDADRSRLTTNHSQLLSQLHHDPRNLPHCIRPRHPPRPLPHRPNNPTNSSNNLSAENSASAPRPPPPSPPHSSAGGRPPPPQTAPAARPPAAPAPPPCSPRCGTESGPPPQTRRHVVQIRLAPAPARHSLPPPQTPASPPMPRARLMHNLQPGTRSSSSAPQSSASPRSSTRAPWLPPSPAAATLPHSSAPSQRTPPAPEPRHLAHCESTSPSAQSSPPPRSPIAQPAVRHPRHRVRLKRQRRHAQQDRRQHPRPARIPAHAHHHLRPELAQISRTHSTTPSGRSHRPQPRRQAHILQLPRPHQLQPNPASGTSRVSSPRAVPTNRTSAPCAVAQLPRNRQRRNHMPAGPPARNQNPHCFCLYLQLS
jgi:hypothetical protein